MKILSFVSQYGPDTRSSGPAESMRGVVEALGDFAEISIVTPHRREHDAEGLVPSTWHHERANVRWTTMPSGMRSLPAVARIIAHEQPDIVYLNSFFDRQGSIWPLLSMRWRRGHKPVIVLAARGEMAPKALALGAIKKKIYILISRLLGLHRDVVFQAGGALEQQHMQALYPDNEVRNLSDVGQAPPADGIVRERGNDNALRLLFLSRITPMKNLHLAMEALASCTEPVSFSIYGPDRDHQYFLRCRELEKRLPDHIQVHWHGQVKREDVLEIMRRHDLFILPTRGEGFGHVIHEALTAGTPVLISDRTNWDVHLPDGLSWVVPLDDGASALSPVIDMLAKESVGQRQRRSTALLAADPAGRARQQSITETMAMFEALVS